MAAIAHGIATETTEQTRTGATTYGTALTPAA